MKPDNNFTFQSGSIQICKKKVVDFMLASFTFQSGSIQMHFAKIPKNLKYTLHSNLVLFKYYHSTSVKQVFEFFTFQSGSIQIEMMIADIITPSVFTFQSGSIQMAKQVTRRKLFSLLYIPIWFYSNFTEKIIFFK